MKREKPLVVRGMRDFGPEVMVRRSYMIDLIKDLFRRYGFAEMESPAMESLATLGGKYGDEGEQLIFKVLNSGDFLKGTSPDSLGLDYKNLGKMITTKGLRYDLTVPLARYVAEHRHEIKLPFKRFQIQPVWRADRPQKGRFREFYQCDADIMGSDSLFYETEILAMVHGVFRRLGIDDFMIDLNHRLVLKALAKKLGVVPQEGLLCVALDKLEKIGWEKVGDFLRQRGMVPEVVAKLEELIYPFSGSGLDGMEWLEKHLGSIEEGRRALCDLREIFTYMDDRGIGRDQVAVSPTLARGMGYYTGSIFEVKVVSDRMLGSVAGGGRYDELGTVFGMPPCPSIGFSLGLERIYEVLLRRGLFPENEVIFAELLLFPLGRSKEKVAMQWLSKAREAGFRTELFPAGARLQKVLAYANHKGIPWVAMMGEDEGVDHCKLKNMLTGKEFICKFEALLAEIRTPKV